MENGFHFFFVCFVHKIWFAVITFKTWCREHTLITFMHSIHTHPRWIWFKWKYISLARDMVLFLWTRNISLSRQTVRVFLMEWLFINIARNFNKIHRNLNHEFVMMVKNNCRSVFTNGFYGLIMACGCVCVCVWCAHECLLYDWGKGIAQIFIAYVPQSMNNNWEINRHLRIAFAQIGKFIKFILRKFSKFFGLKIIYCLNERDEIG